MYRRSRPCHTLSSRPWAERQDLVYGFSAELAFRQVGTYVPLSPSLGLSQRAETTLLNKSVEISTTTGRFCSRCHLCFSGNNKSRLSFRTSGRFSINHCILSGQSAARAKAPGPRYPLDPVLLRHTQISHSASWAVGTHVP